MLARAVTAEHAPETRTVVLRRSDRPGWWPEGYWSQLVGLDMRIPAGVIDGRTIYGRLVEADESGDEEILLTFADVGVDE